MWWAGSILHTVALCPTGACSKPWAALCWRRWELEALWVELEGEWSWTQDQHCCSTAILQLIQAQLIELNDQYEKLNKSSQQLFQELGWLERERSNSLISRLQQADLEADKESVLLGAMRKQLTELEVFVSQYSYNPFDGLNEQPELELPLVPGHYVYIFGDMDEDGWCVGELHDDTRGFFPSSLVEEVQ